jgi:hypothetical protein
VARDDYRDRIATIGHTNGPGSTGLADISYIIL